MESWRSELKSGDLLGMIQKVRATESIGLKRDQYWWNVMWFSIRVILIFGMTLMLSLTVSSLRRRIVTLVSERLKSCKTT
jgi:hypothetical protein